MAIELMETEDDASEFTLSEVLEMEHLYRKRGKEVKQQAFCEELAAKFSGSANRNGKSIIKWDQVHTWFLDRQLFSAAVKSKSSVVDSYVVKNKLAVINSSPIALKHLVALSKAQAAVEIPKKPKAQRVEETADLIFEALSAKDCAWYDVAAFLTFRVMYTGELEVRVRFSGFGHDQDEWVNVRNAVRERSIPLVASECHTVKVGDHVLCYKANEDHALYSDAHVLRIERQLHDKEDCTCTFVVRFEYDNAEMEVKCSEVCCRPS
ncbi:protein SAWADEE HOMEODOMAIN HOMOLOG 1-like [Bidens hawaiensis]|uniref:protein SAWADEE HOMEODOMAIN HOMOLOG 1-like n=1 Tax=Bidens hawaiensis TaxID=980011 RepID=UPI004049FCB6